MQICLLSLVIRCTDDQLNTPSYDRLICSYITSVTQPAASAAHLPGDGSVGHILGFKKKKKKEIIPSVGIHILQ